MKNSLWKIVGGVVGVLLLLAVPALVSAFNASEHISVSCDQNNNVAITVNFTNNESLDSLNVSAKDNQTNHSVDLGTVAPGQTATSTISTGLQSIGAGSVTYTIVKTTDQSSTDTQTLTYGTVFCDSSATPTPTQSITPTSTPTITPTSTPTATPTDTPMPTATVTPMPSATPTPTPTSVPTTTPTGTTTNDCESTQASNTGITNGNCNNNNNTQSQNQTQNNNQTINITNNTVRVLGATTATSLPSTGTPLSDLLFLGSMLPAGLFLRKRS